jgi:hypothetical protein
MLKLKSQELRNKLVLYTNITTTSSVISGGPIFSSHIYYSGNEDVSRNLAIENKLPIFNMTNCEPILKQYYNMSEDSSIIYMADNFNSTLNVDKVNSYKLSAFDSTTRRKLDLDICQNTTQQILMPLSNITDFNITLYKEMKAQGIDILNPDDPYFNDRCQSFADNQTGADTTINYRRANYLQKRVPKCYGLNCTYQGVTNENYIRCNCTGIQTDIEILNKSFNYVITFISQFNIDIIKCYNVFPVFYV